MSEPEAGIELPPAETLIAIHERLIALYGGAPGLRDPGALEAALARPSHLATYGNVTAVPHLAAAVAYGICRIRHPFVDGNKRVAFAALFVILDMNGFVLDVAEAEATRVVLEVAEVRMSEEDFAAWVQGSAYRAE